VPVLLIFSQAVDVDSAQEEISLRETNPRKFDYVKPLRQWKKDWSLSYHRMLSHLKEKWPEGRGIQEFVRILHLHKDYPAELFVIIARVWHISTRSDSLDADLRIQVVWGIKWSTLRLSF
jgi:hypothetical protein